MGLTLIQTPLSRVSAVPGISRYRKYGLPIPAVTRPTKPMAPMAFLG
jgi:hypothetical protein